MCWFDSSPGHKPKRSVSAFLFLAPVHMFYIYAIKSLTRNYIYVGMTDNLERRFLQHQNGLNKTTKAYRPFILFYTEEFKTRMEARQREIFFKSGAGKELLKLKLKLRG